MKKTKRKIPQRKCLFCGENFRPKYSTQKHCSTCSKKALEEYKEREKDRKKKTKKLKKKLKKIEEENLKNNYPLHYVYMIHCRGGAKKNTSIHYYKIGITNNLLHKICGLQIACPLELSLRFWARFKTRYSAEKAEKETHQYFKKNNIRGEWFQFYDYAYGGRKNHDIIGIKRVMKYISQQQNVVEISEQINGLTRLHSLKEGDRHFIQI